MSVVAALVGRNLRLFFRDRLNVFFSLLSGIILFVLYTLFLTRLQTDALAEAYPAATDAEIRAFVDSWMFSGIVLLTSVTSGLGAISAFVEDRYSGRFADFLVAPIRRTQLVLGYLLAAMIVAVIMSSAVLAVSVVYLGVVDGAWVSPGALGRIVLVMLLCCAAFTALCSLVASFVRTSGAYTALATIIGTALGFVAGAYIPVGSLPGSVATTINALPFAQAAMLLRRPFTADTLAALAGSSPDAEQSLREFYGIDISVADAQIPVLLAVAVLAVMAVGFAALSAGRIRALIR